MSSKSNRVVFGGEGSGVGRARVATTRARRQAPLRVLGFVIVAAAALLLPQGAHAQTLTATPVAWNTIGLDSNDVTVGPNDFPLGAKVCASGATANNVVATFSWDTGSTNPYVDLRAGTSSTVSLGSIAAGSCADAFFEVQIVRNAAAYDTTRRYTITVTSSNAATVTTPTPREVYIEHLISQSRNSVTDMQVGPVGGTLASVSSGGSFTLIKGSSYDIKLVASTATNGYEQLETFINFPNTIFQINKVSTTYTAVSIPNDGGVTSPYSRLYADSCVWENNPYSPNYRACNGVGKAGGNIEVTYTVTILSVPSSPLVNPEPLSTLVHDFSGSSYHYNADYGTSARYVYILDPAALVMSKSFIPSTIQAGGTSTLKISIPNPSPSSLSGVNFVDPLPSIPAQMTVATSPSTSSTNCGTPSITAAGGATSWSASNITIPANSTCTITVNVSVPASPTSGSYVNTTNHLFINSTDTGSGATATLTVAPNGVQCVAGVTMAQWTVPSATLNPPDDGAGNAGTRAANVATATVVASQPANTSITTAGNPGNAWQTYGYKTAPTQALTFTINTKNYSNVAMTWSWDNESPSNGPTIGTVTSNLGGSSTITPPPAAGWVAGPTISGLTTSTTGTTTFTVNMTNAKNDNSGAAIDFDNITFTGCSYAPPPNITKVFNPSTIVAGSTPSLLTFTVNNNTVTSPVYDNVALSGVNVSDTLPTGLTIVNTTTYPASTTCSGGAGGTVTATNGGTTVSLTGASLAALGSCTFSVYVTGSTSGTYTNVSGLVGATESGTNKGPGGFATANLTVIAPPVIAKSFGTAEMLTGSTTSLTFTITNPNPSTALLNVAFSDSLPNGFTVASPNGLTGSCGGGTITATAGSGAVILTGATLAGGASCSFKVNVVGTATTLPVTLTNNVTVFFNNGSGTFQGNTATASITLTAPHPSINLLKQVGTTSTGPWKSYLVTSTSTSLFYRFLIENNGDVTLTGVNFTDDHIPSSTTNTCSWVDPNTNASLGSAPLTLTAGSQAACVLGFGTAAASTTLVNTATATGTYSGNTYTDTSSATYSTTTLTIVKLVSESLFSVAGDVLHYTYAVTNTSNSVTVGPTIHVCDDKIDPSGYGTCTASATLMSCPSTSLAPLATMLCTDTYTVTTTDISNGSVTNHAYAKDSGTGTTSNIATRTVPKSTPLTISKSDGKLIVEVGSSTTYTITVVNNGPTANAAGTLTDPAVSALTVTSVGACTASGGATCPSGITAAALQGSGVSIAASSIPVGGSFSFTITATVNAPTVSSPLTFTNTASVVAASITATDKDTDIYALNFGHLPSSFGAALNLLANGGAYTLSGSTKLGGAETDASDGINTTSFTPKATDDGVTWTPAVPWTAGGTGSLDFTVTCPSPPCYLNGWFDFNADSTFQSGLSTTGTTGGDQLFNNIALSPGTSTTVGSVTVTCNSATPFKCTLTFPIPSNATFSAGITHYARFRLGNAPMSTTGGFTSPAGQALTSGGVPLIGEIEDYPFQVTNGQVPTPVTVSFFRTFRESGSGVTFRWSTATETGNLGFNLYVKQGDQLVRVNDELIPSKAVDSLHRVDYAYRADGVEGDTFFVEDVGVRGDTRRHGPYALARQYGSREIEQKIDWPTIKAEHAAMQTVERAAMAEMGGLAKAAPAATTVQLQVRNTGIQRVTYEALVAAGVPIPDSTDKMSLSNRGVAVPIYAPVKKLAPGTWFEFYGQALDTMYTDTNVYTLRVGGTGKPTWMQQADGTPVLGATAPASYTETFALDRKRAYANYSPSGDAWYDTAMLTRSGATSFDFPFQLDALADPSAPASAEIVAWGVTGWPASPDHHLVASLNGSALLDQTFDGLVAEDWQVPLAANTLQAGTNTLRLTLPGDTGVPGEIVDFVRLKVSYQRLFQARDGRLTFTAQAGNFQVTSLPTSDVVVYRVDAKGPRRLSNVLVQPGSSGFTATFAGDASQAATYVVSTGAAVYVPAPRVTAVTTDLTAPADYLVIAHPDFIAGLQPLVAARTAQGLRVNVVNVNDIYNAYSSGVFDPQAIRSYIAWAVANLGTRSVLLVGGDTFDYRNYLGGGSISFIPSLYAPTGPTVRFVPADALYADFNGDGVPDVAIGRFPVRTTAELATVINKTLAYQNKGYGRTALFASDKHDGGLSFKNLNSGFIAALGAGWTAKNISLDDLTASDARAQIIAAMNSGTAMVTFSGHSGPAQWTDASPGLFTVADAQSLTNAGMPFVVVQWGCWNTYYVDPVNTYLVQSFLFSGDKGAAAVMGALTLTDAGSEELLGNLLTPLLATPGKSIGQALLEAKQALAQQHPGLADVQLGWTLMGDPQLVIQP